MLTLICHTSAMFRRPILLAALACAASPAASDPLPPASAFAVPGASETRPLRIELENGIQFSRLALLSVADGEAEIDAQSGAKRVSRMVDLGGLAWQGRARITGEPLRPVHISLPSRVVLRSLDGSEATLSEFVTNLPAVAMLDQSGTLDFAFGAKLATQGAKGGDFRGRIAIDVEYY